MSTVMRPRGPLPSRVYWTRRLLVLLGIVIVILLIWRIFSAFGGSNEAKPQLTPSAPITQAATPSEQSIQNCKAATMKVAAQPQQPSFADGQTPTFAVTATNVSATKCTIDTDPKAWNVEIISGEDKVFNTAHCPITDARPALKLVEPGKTVTFNVTWDGNRSAEGCPSGQVPPSPGTYHAFISQNIAKSNDVTFDLG